MTILKWSVRIHKWIALLIGVQILLWIADLADDAERVGNRLRLLIAQ